MNNGKTEEQCGFSGCRGAVSRRLSAFILAAFLLYLFLGPLGSSVAAQFKTPNFVVTASTPALAKKVAQCAEESRDRLSELWLGTRIQPWTTPCPIRVKCGPNMGAGGETTFTFMGNEIRGWRMNVQGTEERILDSVVPHEVSHTILATYFCRPVPRWIDEGAATSVEANVERNNYRTMLIGFLQEHRGIPFNKMVQYSDYPADMMPFYSQGFSVCEYLISVGGHRRLIEFAKAGMATGDWSGAVARFYGYKDLGDLQVRWTDWISQWYNAGRPSDLPMVAKIEDYPYDIFGRRISGAAGSNTMVAANVNPNAQNTANAPNSGANVPNSGAGSSLVAANSGNTPAWHGGNPEIIRPVNPLNSFVALPKSGNLESNTDASFDGGVGTTAPDSGQLVASNDVGDLKYQGSYGRRQVAPASSSLDISQTAQDGNEYESRGMKDPKLLAQIGPVEPPPRRGPMPPPPLPRHMPPPYGSGNAPMGGTLTILGQSPPF